MNALRVMAMTALVLTSSAASAANYCGGVWHQNSCGRPTNIYPCCDNGSNCTWWAWESMCRNWGIGPNNWGNANTWAGNARVDPRFELVGPVSGAVATSTFGLYGHVAWTIGAGGGGVTVTEQNCCPTCSGNVLTRSYSSGKFNSGYVVPAGSLCECSPGQQETHACGDCGTTTRVCGSSCRWGGFSACGGPDPEGGNKACSNGLVGVCADARVRCESGTLACRQLSQPSKERCDGLDNDCDGEVDEGNPTEGASERDFASTVSDLSFPRSAPAGTTVTAWVEFKNSGRSTWERDEVWLAARPSAGETVSAFAAETWPAFDLAGRLPNRVAPGEVGRFVFELKVPATPGARLEEVFQLEGAGRTPILCPSGQVTVTLLVLEADGSEPDAGVATTQAISSSTASGCSSVGDLSGLAALLALVSLALRSGERVGVRGLTREKRPSPGAARRPLPAGAGRGVWMAFFGALAGCVGNADVMPANRPMTLLSTTPATVTARGGQKLTLRGRGFTDESLEVLVGRQRVRAEYVSATELIVRTPALMAGREPVVLAPDSPLGAELLGGLPVTALDLRFVEAPPYSLTPAAGTLGSAALSDVDGDGDLDLLTCGSRCEVMVNDGVANFASPADGGTAWTTALTEAARLVSTRDFDLDGADDLVLARGGAVEVWLHASPTAPTFVAHAVEAVTVGDLEGDGRPELITVENHVLRITRLNELPADAGAVDAGALDAGEDAGIADAGVVLTVQGARALTVADVDGDGRGDVVVATDAADGIALRLVLSARDGLREVPGGLPGSPVRAVTALVAGDFTGDGAVDLFVVGAGQDRLLVNDGAAHFFDASSTLLPVDNSNGTSVVAVDLDRDRDLDLVVGNAGATARVYVNDGAGHFLDKSPLLPIATRTLVDVRSGDLDGDGDEDLALFAQSALDSHLYLSVEPRP